MTNKTRKRQKISGSFLYEKAGWKAIHIKGEPFERGFAHGVLLYKELRRLKQVFPFVIREQLDKNLDEYMKKANSLLHNIIKTDFPEYYQEIIGISKGAKSMGVNISVDFLIGWNGYMSMGDYYMYDSERCSAFIATGNATKDGRIVMAHNTHTDFSSGQLFNIIINVTPDKGNFFIMQSAAGLICSTTDWFICSNGLIGCETTIGDINYRPKFGAPFFCRIREVMQYANSFEDCIEIMKKKNAGDYACSWLFGNTKTDEIMLFELGLKEENIKKTKNGVFYGMNSALGEEIRKKETNDIDLGNISTSSGSRCQRLNFLLNKEHYGKINIDIAKDIISDHYDIYLKQDVQNSRSICKHNELDNFDPSPYYLWGALDGKVVDSKMAENMSFLGRFGSSCGKRAFSVKDFIKEHKEYEHWKPYLCDLPNKKWVELNCKNFCNKKNNSRKLI